MRRFALLALLVALAGCGGGDDERRAAPEDVIRAWSDDMRRGDIDAATARFAVPAVVANGTPEITLDSRQAVRLFNQTLPCGSRLVDTHPRGKLVVATFVLTDRPGGDCGSGTGQTAKAAFEIRDGRIVRWLRVLDGPPPGAAV